MVVAFCFRLICRSSGKRGKAGCFGKTNTARLQPSKRPLHTGGGPTAEETQVFGPGLPTIEDALQMMETGKLEQLANKEAFTRFMNFCPEEEKAHLHILQKAASLIDTRVAAEGTKANDGRTFLLLKTIIKNTFSFFPRFEEGRRRGYSSQWDMADEQLAMCKLWDRRDVVIAWFEAGLPILSSFLARSWPDVEFDEEIHLLIANHCHPCQKRWWFQLCPLKLTEKRQFVLEAVKADSSLYNALTRVRFKDDFDLATLFFAGVASFSCYEFLHICGRRRMLRPKFWEQLSEHLKRKTEVAVAFQQLNEPFSRLYQLDDHMRHVIRCFLGIQSYVYEQLQIDLRALRNLSIYLRDENIQDEEKWVMAEYERLTAMSPSDLTPSENHFWDACSGF